VRWHRALRGRRSAWDEAGRRNPFYYIATERSDWNVDAFFASGESLLQRRIDPWLSKTLKDTRAATALEIGAGVGRLSRALSHRFAEVIAVDIAPSMAAKGRELNSDRRNLRFAVNAGNDLSEVASGSCDFVLCVWVFQHIPTIEIIDDYLKEIARVIKPTGTFVLQIQGSRFPWPYANVRNYLVRTGRWTQLLTALNGDATEASAFPGVLLGLSTLRRLCLKYQLRIIDTVLDEAPAAHWIYGQPA
jgi:SAM-dependent methyltransferase